MEDEIFNSFGFLLVRLVRAHRDLIRKEMHTLGLHRGQPHVLFALHQIDGRSNSELAAFLEITPATLTNKIKRMEKAGLVQRRRDPEDERVSRIYLTEKGYSLIEDLSQSMRDMEAVLLEGFDEAETRRLKSSLEKVLQNLENHAKGK
ncbi:MAG: MarR family winged helix-turn-helix transcriptional regulator [Brevefilum sp.]